ncbi:MAG: UvrD-helicase domain-containing protein [Planctomycetes bacterium]|nr:UvrD-helicase domain-containing protein [Planctomycetota bacterium]
MTASPPFDLIADRLDEGTVVLEASAGTGKTYTLTGIVLRLLLEGQVQRLEQILVVTFTIAATDELKARLRRGLQQALGVLDGDATDDTFLASLARHGAPGRQRLREALDQFDQLGVQTMHGFCKRLLDDAAFESHELFEVDFATDEHPLWLRAAADALRRVRAFDGPLLADLLHGEALDPETLIPAYRAWRRHPDVSLDPAQPDLQQALLRCEVASRDAARLWSADAADRLQHADYFAQKSPLPADAEGFLRELTARLAGDPRELTGTLRSLSRRLLGKRTKKHSRQSFDQAFFIACDAVADAADLAAMHLRSHLLLDMHARLEAHKRRDRVMTFQDLLERAHAALHDPARAPGLLAALRQRYLVGLIDEFQDTDALQYEIFARIFANRPLFLIGDPKQSIYGFRGADLDTYTAAVRTAVATPTLPTNHRSASLLVQAVSHLFAREAAFVLPGLGLPAVRAKAGDHDLLLTGDDAPPLRWRLLPPPPWGDALWGRDQGREAIANDVADEIERLLASDVRIDGRRLRAGDIAVLTRLNIEATLVQETLRRRAVHAVIGKAGDVFQTDERHDLERLLRAVLQPLDLQLARAAMATRLWGLSAAELQALDSDDLDFDDQLARLEGWRQAWTRSGFFVMQERVLDELDTTARLLQQTGGERRLTNLQQLAEMLHAAEHEHRLSPEGLLRWLGHEAEQQDEVDYQRRELRLESDADAVQILTMHGSKGLQYEVVFCPFLWDGRMPVLTNLVTGSGGRKVLVPAADKDDPAVRAADRLRLAEDVRLAYVAVTRARRRCYVHWGPIGSRAGYHRSALGWLLPPFVAADDWPPTAKDLANGLEAALRAHAAAGGGSMDVTCLDSDALARPRPLPPVPCALPEDARLRPAPAKPLPSRRAIGLFSFTSLVANRPAEVTARDVRDPALPADSGPGRGIFGFARGAAAGVCLHDILEHVPLHRLDDDASRRVEQLLATHGLLEPGAHPGAVEPLADVMQNLRDLAAAVLPQGPSLATLTQGARSAEWQFTFPLTGTDLHQLARTFAEHGGDVAQGYAPRLAALPPRLLQGFVNGFADLIAEHDGRYWLLDWKSNHLGDRAEHYGGAALRRSMAEHDYVLQYHLYALALHRHLTARLPGYDYDRHFGGAVYVYLRGAIAGTTNGLFVDRPPRPLLAAMDRWAAASRGGRR